MSQPEQELNQSLTTETFEIETRDVRFYRADFMCRRCNRTVMVGFTQPVARITPKILEEAVHGHRKFCGHKPVDEKTHPEATQVDGVC